MVNFLTIDHGLNSRVPWSLPVPYDPPGPHSTILVLESCRQIKRCSADCKCSRIMVTCAAMCGCQNACANSPYASCDHLEERSTKKVPMDPKKQTSLLIYFIDSKFNSECENVISIYFFGLSEY